LLIIKEFKSTFSRLTALLEFLDEPYIAKASPAAISDGEDFVILAGVVLT